MAVGKAAWSAVVVVPARPFTPAPLATRILASAMSATGTVDEVVVSAEVSTGCGRGRSAPTAAAARVVADLLQDEEPEQRGDDDEDDRDRRSTCRRGGLGFGWATSAVGSPGHLLVASPASAILPPAEPMHDEGIVSERIG